MSVTINPHYYHLDPPTSCAVLEFETMSPGKSYHLLVTALQLHPGHKGPGYRLKQREETQARTESCSPLIWNIPLCSSK